MLKISALLLIFLLGNVLEATEEPLWNSLFTKEYVWNMSKETNQMKLYDVLTKLPRTVEEAKSFGYKVLKDGCGEGTKFLGYRYYDKSTKAILIFDASGYIAGIQTGIQKAFAEVHTAKHFKIRKSKLYQLDLYGGQETYFMTTYFIEPSLICLGRTKEEFEEQGTVTGLYFQTGRNPQIDYIETPVNQCEMLGTRWNKGGCIDHEGIRFFYELCGNHNCSDWFPYHPLYFDGQLIGFDVMLHGNWSPIAVFKPRSWSNEKASDLAFRHPEKKDVDKLIPAPIPQCIYEDFESNVGFSILQFFFTSKPKISCELVEKM